MFQKAERKQAKLRLALMGSSGSGKTYSSLLLAKGLGGRIAFIDTEHRSGDLYADLVDFDIMHLGVPFSVEKFIDGINAAELSNYDVLIIDSISHAWSGEGGVLDYVDRVSKSNYGGNSYVAWRQGGKYQDQLINRILSSQMHVIVTMRSKTEYIVDINEKGKSAPRKIGMAPVQRDNVEYEFTTVLDLSIDNIATASKDRTQIFNEPKILTSQDGIKLNNWLNSGKSIADIAAEKDEAIRIILELIQHAHDFEKLKEEIRLRFNELTLKFGVEKEDPEGQIIIKAFNARKLELLGSAKLTPEEQIKQTVSQMSPENRAYLYDMEQLTDEENKKYEDKS